MAPVPAGVAGELLIGGAGVTRGYSNRPDLTAGRFVPDPLGGGSGDRLYRTGDVARWLPDGNLEFLGRRDRQVKVRGVRVELDEIEALLGEHPGLSEVAVVAFEGPGLVAYVVPGGGRIPAAGELRGFLRDRVPEPMVPSHFVPLQGLPRTRTGKVDRGALPAPERSRPGGAERRPLTEVEGLLAVIWSQVLGVEEVGPEDGFFELGGHSLLAAQLTARVQEAFGVELPLRTLFEATTVAALAERVESAMGAGGVRRAPALERVPRGGALPVSFAQHRLWFLQQLDPAAFAFNVPRAVRLRGRLGSRGVALLARATNEIVRRHETLRTTFAEIGGEPRQVITPPRPLPLAVVDLAGLPDAGQEAERLILEAARTPFDLAAGPLLRSSLLRLREDEHLLLFNIHHIVSDDWSMGVLVGELSALYEAFSRGEGSPLPELPVQYADYAAWQRRWLEGEVLEERLAYWRRKLAGRIPVLELPFARPRPADPSYGGARQSFALPASLSRALAELGRAEGATLFMVLLAAFQTLLHRYTGEEDVCRRHRCGQPRAGGDRGLDRVLREPARAALRSRGQPDLPRAVAAGPGGGARGLHSSGPAVRAAGGGSCSRSGLRAARRSSSTCWSCRTPTGGVRAARVGSGAVRSRQPDLEVRPGPDPDRGRRGARRHLELQHRSVRP